MSLATIAESAAMKANDAIWQTAWLSPSQCSNRTVAELLRCGDAVLIVPDVATKEECAMLVNASTSLADDQLRVAAGEQVDKLDPEGRVRLPTFAAASRMGKSRNPTVVAASHTMLPVGADSICTTILHRAIDFIDQHLPSVVVTLFGCECGTLGKLYETDALEFASREPAVNVYMKGGEFLAHKDHQAITVLVALTEPEAFEGGGTGFWAPDSRGHRVEGPSVILRPPAGAAMLFGGHVTHAGIPVESGTRAVFVASFSLPGGCAESMRKLRQQRAEEAAQTRDIYGDLI
jgi:hypothetical protein